MPRIVSAAADSHGDPLASSQIAFPGTASAAIGAATGTGILWMLAATCLFVCQDSLARILLRSYPTTEIAFARYFVHMVLVTIFLAWRDPRLMISRRPVLQMLRSMLLLGTTLFGMLALKIMPLVDFSAIVWVAPVLVAALSVFILHEKVSPGFMGKRFRRSHRHLGDHWPDGHGFFAFHAVSFPGCSFLSWLLSPTRSIRSRPGSCTVPIHHSQPCFTRRWPEFCFVADFCPLPPPRQTLSMAV
jgi:hypothetical protein